MYKFWYVYIKPKYEDRSKLCYTDTDSFSTHILTEDFFVDISDDVERWLDIFIRQFSALGAKTCILNG